MCSVNKNISLRLVGFLAVYVWWAYFYNVKQIPRDFSYPREDCFEDTGTIYCNLGEAALERKDYKQALDYFKKALFYQPNSSKVYKLLCKTHDKLELTNKKRSRSSPKKPFKRKTLFFSPQKI